MRVFLGFDTSCYTTSMAAVSEDGSVLSSSRMLLPVQSGERGLRQSEAVFAHIRQLPNVAQGLMNDLKDVAVAAVGASVKPVDRDDSYMPVFMAGSSQAQVLANTAQAPFYGFSHQGGHIRAGWIGQEMPKQAYIALHLSGGTTELLQVDGEITPIGGSGDLHAGQLIDRVGVRLGLGFPAGPMLEKLAMACVDKPQSLLPVSMEKGDLFCHLSGAEAACMRLIDQGDMKGDQIALELFDLISRSIARLLLAGQKAAGANTALVVGGVASSSLLRSLLRGRLAKLGARLDVRFGQPQYSGDNAAGIALLTKEMYMKNA